MDTGTPVHVLLEGPSDVAALEVLLPRCAPAVPGTAYRLVDLGGVTNTARALRELAEAAPGSRVVGLCDAGEARVVVRALRGRGCRWSTWTTCRSTASSCAVATSRTS
ncbi:hypothetical protein [Ornithinimicrobium humiphilum]|uniref:hypothetical protein n=1 Tax=Ornithinimicrobium humiphilum TaxID=125288 RepID=UPI0011548437|nr:hypothetical protein [Ornithinimicrobium humiphilum]